MGKRTKTAILAILASIAIACGTTGGSRAGSGPGNNGPADGGAYLMADPNYGVQRTTSDDNGFDGSFKDANGGPALVP